MRRAGHIALRVVLGLLLALGIASAVQRGLSVASEDPGALDREQLAQFSMLTGLQPGSTEQQRLSREIAASTANLNARPGATLWHVIPGAAFFVLVALQFSTRLRARHPAVHRWNGRVILAMAAACAFAGMYLGLANAVAAGTDAVNAHNFAISLWVGWLPTLGAAELWILRTRPRRTTESEAAMQPL